VFKFICVVVSQENYKLINVKCTEHTIWLEAFGFDLVSLPGTSLTYANAYQFTEGDLKDSYFLVEKLGLDMLSNGN